MRDDELMELDEPVSYKQEEPVSYQQEKTVYKQETKTYKQEAKKQSKGFLGKLWANIIARNLIYAIGGLALFIFLLNFLLLMGTQHGKSFPVPNLTGMTIEEAKVVAKENHLRLEVADSVFMPQRTRGTIVRQNPSPNAQVKNGRRVLLTMNSRSPRKVVAPDVVGFSLRQAKAVLQSQELTIGRLRYIPDIATNNVLRQSYKGRSLDGNLKIDAGSAIDLDLGLSETGAHTIIPTLTGLSAEAAKDLLLDNSLNISLNFDKSITSYTDSLSARVYRQMPSPSSSNIWPLGTRVEVYLRPGENTAGKN